MPSTTVLIMEAMGVVGRLVNNMVSFVVFTALDLVDVVLCFVYKLVDFAVEAEWRPCYSSHSAARDVITRSGRILVSEAGMSKILYLHSSKLQLEDISDTLYSRPSFLSEISRSKLLQRAGARPSVAAAATTVTINSTIIEMLQSRRQAKQEPRWSDCACKTCTAWMLPEHGSRNTLFVHVQGPRDEAAAEDVLFIHGFISSSAFWTETVFPNFSEAAKKRYRMFAVDLLGFGRSPKPGDSLYTLREHVEMIERSVLGPYQVKEFHIVAHSLGCILALALAVKFPGAVKSLTLLAPPYFPVPKGEQGTQYVLRRVAPRRVWPAMAFGASVVCWYEHISRTMCLLFCKNHRLVKSAFKLLTCNRVRTFLMDGFFGHTHTASWHTLHNIICGSAGKLDGYLAVVREELNCNVTVFHGGDDEVLPVECSYAVKSRIPRARVKVIDGKDHITIVVGRQKAFSLELEQIWNDTRNKNS